MAFSVKQIYEGWKNDALPSSMTESQRAQRDERIKICTSSGATVDGQPTPCKFLIHSTRWEKIELAISKVIRNKEVPTGFVCSGCGCPMSKKDSSPTSQCPAMEAIIPMEGKLWGLIGSAWYDLTPQLYVRDDVRVFICETKDPQLPSRLHYDDGTKRTTVPFMRKWDKMH